MDRFIRMDVTAKQSEKAKERLGDFIVQGVLGAGGSGTVYNARWGHRTVALKVLREMLVESNSERGRFLEEARLLYEINHPAVVKLLGFGELPDGRPYLAMECLEGETLAERLKRGRLEIDLSLSLLDQLVSAVAALHAQELIHRDIKPENIFLVGDGQYAVLLDFGIAKSADAPMSTVTREGGVRGTPAYMAPERFFGQPANESSDIYELALVFYTMTTGRLPWEDSGDPESRLNPVRPADLGIDLPGDTETVLLKALSTRAEARPVSVVEFGECISQAAAKGGVHPRRRTADMPVPKEAIISPTGPTAVLSVGRRSTNDARITGSPSDLSDRSGERAGGEVAKADRRITGPLEPRSASSKRSVTGPQTDALRRRVTREETLGPIAKNIKTYSQKWRTALLGVAGLVVVAALAAVVFIVFPAGDKDGGRKGSGKNKGYFPSAIEAAAKKMGESNGRGADSKGDAEANDKVGMGSKPKGGSDAQGVSLRGKEAAVEPREILEMLPADEVAVVWLSYSRLTGTGFYKTLVEDLKIPKIQLMVSLVESMCTIEFKKDLQWVAVGFHGHKTMEAADIAVRGTWSRKKIESCIETFGALSDTKTSFKTRGRLTESRFDNKVVWLAWPDENTFLFTTREWGKEGVKAQEKWFRERLERKNNLWSNPKVRRLGEKLDKEKTLWFVGLPSGWIFDKVFEDSGAPSPNGFNVEVGLTKDIILTLGMHYKNEKDATRAAESMRSQLEGMEKSLGLGSLFAKFNSSREKDIVKVVLSIDGKVSRYLAEAIKKAVEEVDKKD